MIRRICLSLYFTLLASAALASSCAPEVGKVQIEVDARIDAIAKTDPGTRESRAALLHHEPTPASIAAAERGLKGDASVKRALVALQKARLAEARGNEKACWRALADARAAIGR